MVGSSRLMAPVLQNGGGPEAKHLVPSHVGRQTGGPCARLVGPPPPCPQQDKPFSTEVLPALLLPPAASGSAASQKLL